MLEDFATDMPADRDHASNHPSEPLIYTRAALRRQRQAESGVSRETSRTVGASRDEVDVATQQSEAPKIAESSSRQEFASEGSFRSRRDARVGVASGARPAANEGAADEFVRAARAFSFANAPSSVKATRSPRTAVPRETGAAHTTPARPQLRSAFTRIATAGATMGVVAVVGLLAVGMTTPMAAVAVVDNTVATTVASAANNKEIADEAEIQAFVTPSTVMDAGLDRESNYDTTTIAEIAAESGVSHFSDLFVSDPNAEFQWPFAVGVPLSSGFGMRDGRLHAGVDFAPGEGAPIQAVAAGTVRVATESGGNYGVHVIIDHEVDGQLVSTHYAHMLYGSLQVVAGQQVTAGTIVGNVGNTGRSFGAHLHFEVLLNGTTPTEPIAWLREYAG